MAEENLYKWTDNPTVSGVAKCDTDVLNDCLMHLKYDNENPNILKTNQITNCLLEVPQRIKLELKDGVLTLKAGSEVIVPNGFEEDGTTPKFDYVTIESDNQLDLKNIPARCFLFWTPSNQKFNFRPIESVYSGNSDPATSATTYYQINNNIVVSHNLSGDINVSLPILIFNSDETNVSIDQVFNGMGRIGSIRWVEANITGLSGQGRNEDGSINNASYTTPTIKLLDCSDWDALSFAKSGYMIRLVEEQASDIRFQPYERFITSKSDATKNDIPYYYYDKENAKWYVKQSNNTNWKDCEVYIYADMTTKGGEFKPRTVFRAVDYNDIAGLKAYITETYINGTSGYRIWSDGYCEQWGVSTFSGSPGVVNFLKPFKDTNYGIVMSLLKRNDAGIWGSEIAAWDRTTTGFTTRNGTSAIGWQARGYIS